MSSCQSETLSQNYSKVNSTFFNRKFVNIPRMNAESLRSELNRLCGQVSGQSIFLYRVFVTTKYQVQIDVGMMQYSLPSKSAATCYIHKLYISRIYRKLSYANYIYIKVMQFIFEKSKNADKIQLHLNSRCNDILKFLYAIGFKLSYVENEKQLKSRQKVLLLAKKDFQNALTEISQAKKIQL